MEMAARIKQARELRGLSQSELARRLKLRPQSVQHWETGKAQPRLQRVKALSQVLDVNETWLATGAGPMMHGDAGGWVQLTPDERALLEKYRLLNQMGKGYAQKALDAFASEEGDGKVGNDG